MVPNAGGAAAFSLSYVATARAAVIVACLGLAACRADAPTASAGPPAALERVSGDGQSAPPGAALEQPLVARLVVDGLDAVVFVAFVDASALPERVPLHSIAVVTADGSGQVVHPDVALPPFEALDETPRLAITPYPWGNANFENPSIFTGSRDTWRVPSGLTNPVVKPNGGYLSDPDIVWLSDRREFWLYYRHVDTENEILVTSSIDGVRWGPSREVVRAPNHQVVSPTVVRRTPTDWLMWSVNSGSAGCSSPSTTVELRRSVDGASWSSPTTVALSQPGVFPWHIEVQWIASLGKYWAMFNGKVAGSCTTDALYIATSADGVAWRTYRSPVLRRGSIPELADVVYRATFAYEADRDLVSIWHSGAMFTPRTSDDGAMTSSPRWVASMRRSLRHRRRPRSPMPPRREAVANASSTWLGATPRPGYCP